MKDGKSRFWRNFRKLAGANVAALVIMVGLAPVLGWIYPPEAFGYLAYFMFVFQMLTSVCTFRFDWLMPNVKSTTEELGLMALGVAAMTLISIAFVLGFWFPPSALARWEGYVELGPLLMLVPVAVFGMGLRLLLTARFVRMGDLGPVSLVKITETLGNATASIALGLAGFLVVGLIWARILASWIGAFHLLRRAPINRQQILRLRPSRLAPILRRHWAQAARATLVSFTNTLSTNAPILVLSSIAGAAELGLFFMATRLISTPLQLGARALSQSFWSRSAELARTKQYRQMRQEYLSLLLRLLLIALGLVIVLLGVGLAIEDFFPQRWQGLGATFMAFAPIVLGLVTISATNHMRVLGNVQLQLGADLSRLGLMTVSVFALSSAGMPFWALVLAVSLSSLTGHAILFAMHLFQYHRIIRKKAHRQRRDT